MIAQIFADAMKINLIKPKEQRKRRQNKNEMKLSPCTKVAGLPHKFKWLQNKINSVAAAAAACGCVPFEYFHCWRRTQSKTCGRMRRILHFDSIDRDKHHWLFH